MGVELAGGLLFIMGPQARAGPSPGLSFPSAWETVGLDQWFSPVKMKKCMPMPTPNPFPLLSPTAPTPTTKILILLVWGRPRHQQFVKVPQELLICSGAEADTS